MQVHVNAKGAFPPELVKEIRKYSGGYLRIPKRAKMNRPRKQAKEIEKKSETKQADFSRF
jgi:hypothetical protein